MHGLVVMNELVLKRAARRTDMKIDARAESCLAQVDTCVSL